MTGVPDVAPAAWAGRPGGGGRPAGGCGRAGAGRAEPGTTGRRAQAGQRAQAGRRGPAGAHRRADPRAQAGRRPPVEPQSRGLLLNVDTKAMHVTLKQANRHPAGLLADNQGSVQLRGDGRVLVGWGSPAAGSSAGPRRLSAPPDRPGRPGGPGGPGSARLSRR